MDCVATKIIYYAHVKILNIMVFVSKLKKEQFLLSNILKKEQLQLNVNKLFINSVNINGVVNLMVYKEKRGITPIKYPIVAKVNK